jgi:hypothetical protein
MTEVNLGDLETISGEKEEYWLLAIKAKQMAAIISRVQTQSILQSASWDGYNKLKIHTSNPCACRDVQLLVAKLTEDRSPWRRVALSSGADCSTFWFDALGIWRLQYGKKVF